MSAVETSVGPMEPEQIVDYLNYCNYRHNRQTMSAEQLGKLFTQTGAAMEERYQLELNSYVDAAIHKDRRERHEGRAEDFGASACGRSHKAGA